MKNIIFFIIILHFYSLEILNYVKTRRMLEILKNSTYELDNSLKFENTSRKSKEDNIKKKEKISSLRNSRDFNTDDMRTNNDNLLSLKTNKRNKRNYDIKDYQLFDNIYEQENAQNLNRMGNELNQLKDIKKYKESNKSMKNIKDSNYKDVSYDGDLKEENSNEEYSNEENSSEEYSNEKNSNEEYSNKENSSEEHSNEKNSNEEYLNKKGLNEHKSNKNSSHKDISPDKKYNTNNKNQNYKREMNNIKSNFNKNFLYSELKDIDYSQHGNNWGIGKCKNGKYQSPVDLHLQGLKERDLKNIADVYLNLFYDDDYAWNNYNKPWMKGDIFYYYEYLIKKLVINRKDNIFQIKAANNGVIPFGVLFTTDNPTMFYADQIHFHSPSEHTFQGSGNRREIEMQIFHYTNDIYEYDEEKWKNSKTKVNLNNKFKNDTNKKENNYHSYLVSFLMNSLSNSQLEKKYIKRLKSGKIKNQYQVLSITFTSAEINKSTIDHFKRLPSEKFLRTILNASYKVPVGSEPTLVDLDEVLNLDSLMMMLNIENMEFLSYHGSSTLPLCEENVHWKVAKQPLPVSTELILDFYKMLKKYTSDYKGSDNDNYRVLQNVEDNSKNYGKVYLIQGFPVQVLISSALSTLEDREVINIIKDASTKSFSSYQYFNYFLFYLFFIALKYLYNN
ncbi:carbonic anhydrase, putative [Plasmodium relictum]|uniref:Carbonic anhydrase, putative n=1 Tax=Plasmodium relictum TaxID=85471 RepID=A0A1J1H9K3_PLARL|nr:carbonic anhydrase, putative [Plasmodium relictum]CRH00271.1 carbonic anhydrase, putative [Plasmodium relictum]